MLEITERLNLLLSAMMQSYHLTMTLVNVVA